MSLDKINLGVAGDPQTGDTIYAGGQKLNAMLEEIYQRSGPAGSDFRMTGYWLPDDGPLVDITSSVPAGLRVDVDTTVESKAINLDHSEISYQSGDQIQFRDAQGTWATNPCSFDITDGTINGSENAVPIRSDNAVVTLTCVDDVASAWILRVDSLKGRFDVPLDREASVTPSNDLNAVVYDSANVVSAKIMVTAVLDSNPAIKTVSEVLVTDDGSSTFSTEYAVINTNGEAIFDLSFDYISNQVVAIITTAEPSVTVRVKTVEYTER